MICGCEENRRKRRNLEGKKENIKKTNTLVFDYLLRKDWEEKQKMLKKNMEEKLKFDNEEYEKYLKTINEDEKAKKIEDINGEDNKNISNNTSKIITKHKDRNEIIIKKKHKNINKDVDIKQDKNNSINK